MASESGVFIRTILMNTVNTKEAAHVDNPTQKWGVHVCCLLHTITVLLTASPIVQLTGSAYGSAEAAVDPPALMN